MDTKAERPSPCPRPQAVFSTITLPPWSTAVCRETKVTQLFRFVPSRAFLAWCAIICIAGEGYYPGEGGCGMSADGQYPGCSPHSCSLRGEQSPLPCSGNFPPILSGWVPMPPSGPTALGSPLGQGDFSSIRPWGCGLLQGRGPELSARGEEEGVC